MATLVIHTPQNRVTHEAKRSFEKTLESGIGDEYAIYQNLRDVLSPGCRVVVLDKDRGLRAEGSLVKLVPRSKTKSGVQRYDVHAEKLRRVDYKSEALNRCGISVI